jgi:hypothetical protein
MSNQAFLSETKRNNIIKALVDSDLDLTDQSNLRKAVPNTSVFDIVGSIHYCYHIDALPSKLLPLVTVHKAYGALQSMLENTLKLPKQVGVPPVLSYTGTVTATTLTVPKGTVVEEVTIPSQPTPTKETPVTKKKPAAVYTKVDYHEMVYYIRNNKPKTVTQIADALDLSTSSVYRALYTLMYYNVATDAVSRVIWATPSPAATNIPPKEKERILESHVPFQVATFEQDVEKWAKFAAPVKKQEAKPEIVERPSDKMDIMAMVIKAAKAGDGDAAVKLAQMADLMKRYA